MRKTAKGSRTAIVILLVMGVVLLVIGWANALNLTIARFLERGKEFGLRKVFGASRRQIITQALARIRHHPSAGRDYCFGLAGAFASPDSALGKQSLRGGTGCTRSLLAAVPYHSYNRHTALPDFTRRS